MNTTREMVPADKSMPWTVADVMVGDAAAVVHAAELVAATALTTTSGTSLAGAASLMFQHGAQLLPVVDSENRAVGTVSRGQLLKGLLRSDELIRRAILRILHEVSALRRSHLEVEVAGGLVRLRGEVEPLPSTLIERIATLPGVVGLKNELHRAGDDSPAAHATAGGRRA